MKEEFLYTVFSHFKLGVLAMDKAKKLVFPWCTADAASGADVVLFGVADESGSRANRKGSSFGPDAARAEFIDKSVVFRGKKQFSIMFPEGMLKRSIVYDAGNIKRSAVSSFSEKQCSGGKVVGCVGGDHSITYEILKGIDRRAGSWGFLYIDAHPDFIGSEGRYYGSVAYDLCRLNNVDVKSSFIIGTRATEKEEAQNVRKSGINVMTAEQVFEEGVISVVEKLEKALPENLYVSIDLDSVDPAYAPGVSTPVPGGLESRELLYIASSIGKRVNLGFDVMELNPKHDSGGTTAHLAGLLMLVLSSMARKNTL